MKGKVMSNADYRRAEGISSSELKKIAVSPMHYKYWKDNPQERTPALLFGAAAHKYMLEKNDFDKEFIVAPNCDRRTKEGKAVWQAFVDASNGKEVITQDDMDKIKAMYDALYNTPFVKQLLSGDKELSFFWNDADTGLICKVRPDVITKIFFIILVPSIFLHLNIILQVIYILSVTYCLTCVIIKVLRSSQRVFIKNDIGKIKQSVVVNLTNEAGAFNKQFWCHTFNFV